MKSKGQTLVFEQVLIFTIGVTVFLISFALFMMYQNHYISETTRDQITQVKEYLLSNIIKLCEKEDFNSSIVLDLPQTIGNSLYRISFSPEGLNITMEPETGIYEFSNLYGFNESFTFQGMVISDRGKIVIYKRGNSIYIQ